ncbi:MAG: tRNA lysidine(34) synthetase TilS [Ruminococcaceae bacterium]|nr:tRNA lysidine(34) synthetase TilS [Oscillospiraceae bacterium]
MEQKIRATIQQYAMLQCGDSVAVAVSGGKDSVALLHFLCSLREEFALNLTAVHIHHGIRAQSADRDEAFVRNLSEQFGVAYRCFHFDVPQQAKQRGLSEETCGRLLRYEALESLGTDKIATAHTLSDSVETLLFHLARGSGVKGLCGIPAVRGNIIRPLIDCTSEEVLAYLEQHTLPHMQDESNECEDYARNAIRRQIIPRLAEINGAFETNAAKTMAILREQNVYLEQQALEFLKEHGNDAAAISALPQALKSEVLRKLCREQCGAVPEYRHIQAIESVLGGGQVQINGGATVRVRKGKVEFPAATVGGAYRFAVEPGEYTLPVGVLKVQKINCKQFENFTKDRFSFAVDCDKIKSNLTCRNRQAGDIFFDAKRALHKSMKKYLAEIAWEPEQRAAFPVFLYGEEVIGTLGSTPDITVAPDGDTKEVLYLYLERE